jgi:hypothetical protein
MRQGAFYFPGIKEACFSCMCQLPCVPLQYMTALMQCHKDHTIAKWWGACNDEHWALTRCLAEEKKVVR